MKIKIWQDSTLDEATEFLVENIDNCDMNIEHIVVVPDRFSLLMERLLLSKLKTKALFNVSVVGLSSLVVMLLNDMGESQPEFITMSDGLILTSKAIANRREEFLTFKKSGINFCHQVYNAISQFKSSGVKPQELLRIHPDVLGYKKYHDLALIYEEYENLLAGKLDANALLNLFIEKAGSSKVVKNKKFYFAEFDSWTSVTYEVIRSLSYFTDEINISLAAPSVQGNYYIYEKDIMDKLKVLSRETEAEIEVCTRQSKLLLEQSKIVKNLFSFDLEQGETSNYFTALSSANMQEECAIISKLIRYEVWKGARFKDFAIACSDLSSYAGEIEKFFTLLNIPYYIDLSVTADKTILSNFIFKLLEVYTKNYSQESLIELASNLVFDMPESEEVTRKIQDYNIFGYPRFSTFIVKDYPSFSEVLSLRDCEDFASLCDGLEAILNTHKSSYDKLLEDIKEDIVSYNINLQMWDILRETLDTLRKNYGSEKCLKSEFLKQLKLLLSFKEVSTVPTYLDAVMIGDATTSYFGDIQNLIVLGGERLPCLTADKGLISDDDIDRLRVVRKIEPSIKMINRRNRFKLFNLLASAKNSLMISFCEFNDEGKKVELPSYLDSLLKIFGQKVIHSSSFYQFTGVNEKVDEFRLMLEAGSRRYALSEGVRKSKYYSLISALLKVDEERLTLNKSTLNVDAFKLFFPDEYTKVTELETYFSCPFKHFVRYGLKLKERQTFEFDERDNGNVCHRMAEIFVNTYKHNLDKLTKADIDSFVEKSLLQVIKDEGLEEKLEAAEDRKGVLDYLTRMTSLLLSRIVFESFRSEFKPLYTEKQLDDAEFTLSSGKILKLVGKVDRIDTAGDYFRIFDYKTGRVDPILKDLYYGDKLQLFLYESAVKNSLKKKSAGTFYFDSRWDFDKEGQEGSLLKGLVSNDSEAISLFDKELKFGKSEIVNVKAKKDGSFYGSAIAKFPLDNFESYASCVAQGALNEIENGFIEAKPDSEACAKCKYNSVCLFNQQNGYRKKGRVTQETIMEALKNGR